MVSFQEMQSSKDIRIQNPKQLRGAYHGYQKAVRLAKIR
nr:MAG TPA: hypothetical protein [Bacteriophage sp.]